MKKSQADQTTAKNLEEKFDRGEDVLDYFDVSKARVIRPQSRARSKQGSDGRRNAMANGVRSFVRNRRVIARRPGSTQLDAGAHASRHGERG